MNNSSLAELLSAPAHTFQCHAKEACGEPGDVHSDEGWILNEEARRAVLDLLERNRALENVALRSDEHLEAVIEYLDLSTKTEQDILRITEARVALESALDAVMKVDTDE